MPQKTLTTTVLTVEPHAIDWESIQKQGVFVEYEIPNRKDIKWDYLHNWYLRQSTFPYYLHTPARRLYVLYPHDQAIQALTYDKQQWPWKLVPLQHETRWPPLVKLLVSAFFTQRKVLVSNNDFYLLVSHSIGGFARVLDIDFHHQWRDGRFYEFAVRDKATTLHPLRERPTHDTSLMHGAHYTIDRREGLPVLRRLHPEKITQTQIMRGVYRKPKSRSYRTHIPLLDIRGEEELQRCRSYSLHWFLADLVAYFNEIGLPFHLKELPFQKVSKSSATFKQPQLSLQGNTVALVDDRLRPHVFPESEPSQFADKLIQRIQETLADQEWAPTLVVTEKTDLQPNDLVLRLQDNLHKDFVRPDGDSDDGESGVLAAYIDPYLQFHREFGDTISQSLNINTNAQAQNLAPDDEEEDDEDMAIIETDPETTTTGSAAEYLSYKLPPNDKQFKLRVLNSMNQLCLKLMARYPHNARQRFPILDRLNDNMFLYQDVLVYRDGDALIFMKTSGNTEAARVIQERTGWDIIQDILLPAQQRNDYNRVEQLDAERIDTLLKQGRFIVSPRAVWQIEDCAERVLYNIAEIRQRLRARTIEYPKQVFYPQYTPDELRIFDRQRLEAFAAFLDTTVRESVLSYNQLVQQYKDEGLYTSLGIKNSTKLQAYLRTNQLPLASVKGADVVPAYTGISYLPDTQQYYVGDKYGLDSSYQQERGFVLRRVIVHRERGRQEPLEEQLRKHLFPLLEVNFVRYQQYTVYPFPFKLIEIWNEI
jgi:hypothetical protein